MIGTLGGRWLYLLVIDSVLVRGSLCMTAGSECTVSCGCVCGVGAEDAAGAQIVEVGQTQTG
ncbi:MULTISPECIES: hypothetical protein [unclassified Streptomyces]|uniref:hypothetical protein n=1 Tax=unclassified Streptomyces TaxID=2593676 RepID=UPI0035D9DA62